ncbi:MAG: hypothetical protein ACR2MY_08925 [Candidatus Dormibacteria bacterium]
MPLFALAAIISVVAASTSQFGMAADPASPPVGTLARLNETIPNYFERFIHTASGDQTKSTAFLVDPANGLLFEYQLNGGYQCGDLFGVDSTFVAYRLGSYVAPVAKTCVPTGANADPAYTVHANFFGNRGTFSPLVAIDPIDGVLLVPLTAGDAVQSSLPGGAAQIGVYSEQSLKLLSVLDLPASQGALPVIEGLSWDGTHHQLLVTTSHGWKSVSPYNAPPPGVALSAIGLSGGATPSATPLWTTSLSGCLRGMEPNYVLNSPHRSGGYIFAPCDTGPGAGQSQDTIVRLSLGALDTTGKACQAPATECPQTISSVNVPGQGLDGNAGFIFDTSSGRGFVPVTSQSGITMIAYDGNLNTFLGRTAVGSFNDANRTSFAHDETTGRIYAVSFESGLTVLDGRRTPVYVGSVYKALAGFMGGSELPVLPRDAGHPYTRVLLNYLIGDPGADGKCGACTVPYLTVVGDASPVTVDPPVGDVDKLNTLHGAIPPGSVLTTVYGGNARGYGVHTDFVGGIGGVLSNAFGVDSHQIPFGSGDRDLMAGAVTKLALNNGSAQGAASALADANGNTSIGYAQCSDPSLLGKCIGTPLPQDPPSTAPTQAWPYPDATCSLPGGESHSERAGFYATTSRTSDGKPVTQPLSGTEGASAQVQCSAPEPLGSAMGSGHFSGQLHLGVPGFPVLDVASGSASTSVAPPAGGAGAVSSATATAHGIHIVDISGRALSIGEVTQTATASANGRPGTATTVRDVSISVNGASTIICAGICTGPIQQVFDQINVSFPHIHISQPEPDVRYVHDEHSGNGSPGGYIAVVQANQTEQFGDQQFNRMTPEESTFLPAMRIVFFNDGRNQLNRLVNDLAGVEVDAELGLSSLPPPGLSTLTCQGSTPSALVPPEQAASLAATGSGAERGFPSASAPDASSSVSPDACLAAASAAGVPGVTTQIPGSPGTPGTPGTPGSPGGQGTASGPTGPLIGAANGIYKGIVRFFEGFRWLWRSPQAALQMLSYLMWLGLPLLLMARRRLWLHDLTLETR